MRLKIKVTKEILERSHKCKSDVGENCAIALAVRDIFPRAWVYEHSISPFFGEYDSVKYVFSLPYEATMFIHRFDKTKEDDRLYMPELEFEVEIPDVVIDKINIDEIKPLLENHPTLELI